MKYEHLIFDCDGVLVDTEIVAAETMVPVLSTLGHSVTVKHYLSKYTGKTFKAIFEMFEIDKRVDTEMLIKNIEEKVYSTIRPVKGIQEVIKSIALPKSVVSNSNFEQIEAALNATGLTVDFDHQFSSSIVKRPKPSPDVYNHAAKHLAIDPKSVLVIEDSVSGCTAALSADMNVIGFCGGSHIMPTHKNELEKIGVQYVANDAKELKEIIEQLISKKLTFENPLNQH